MFDTKTRSRRMRLLVASTVAVAALVLSGCSGTDNKPGASDSEGFPNKTIHVVIPFGAGGGTDADARAIIGQMDKAMNVSVIAENVAGGGGTLGLMQAMSKPADGYTVGLVFPSIHSMGQVILDAKYDLASMEYLGGFRESFNMIGTAARSGIKTLDQLIAHGKKQGRLIVVSGPKSPYIVTAKLIADEAGVDLQVLSYEGVPQAFAGLEAGDGDFWMGGDGAASGLGADMNVLAYAAPKRSALLPDVATLAELGFNDFYLDPISAGFVVRGDMDPAIIEKLRSAFKDAALSTEIANYAKTTKANMVYRTPEEFKKSVVASVTVTEKYKALLKED